MAGTRQVVVAVEDVDERAENALNLREVLVVAEFDQERQQPQHLANTSIQRLSLVTSRKVYSTRASDTNANARMYV